ncbi:hypothetical protein C8R47DRAFT_923183, partial [Mycena vitilis]
ADPFTPKSVQSVVTQAPNPAEIDATLVKGRCMLLLDNAAKESRVRKEQNARRCARQRS